MKTFETIVIPARAEQRCTHVACDLCGKAIGHEAHEVDKVRIEYENGFRYPEIGDVEVLQFDMCGSCFKKKLVPWMKAQGAAVGKTYEEW
jgi:hypothetical protein